MEANWYSIYPKQPLKINEKRVWALVFRKGLIKKAHWFIPNHSTRETKILVSEERLDLDWTYLEQKTALVCLPALTDLLEKQKWMRAILIPYYLIQGVIWCVSESV